MAEFKVRCEDGLKERLEQLAKDDGRSLNSYVVRVLEAHATVERKGQEAGRRFDVQRQVIPTTPAEVAAQLEERRNPVPTFDPDEGTEEP